MILEMPSRSVCRSFQLDTNRINSRGELKYMNQLELWNEDGVILLEMSEVSHREAKAGGSIRRARKALRYVYSMTFARTEPEQNKWREIEAALFVRGALSENQENDVEIVFNAWKYGRILITDDGSSKNQPAGIVGNRGKLRDLGVEVMRDYEAVSLVKELIVVRDQSARKIAKMTGLNVPSWVGKD